MTIHSLNIKKLIVYTNLLVFLILMFILGELIKSNELRTGILRQQKQFNSELSQLQQTTEILSQGRNIEDTILAFGASIRFHERNIDGIQKGNRLSKGGN